MVHTQQKILVATTNPGKLRELEAMLGEIKADIQWLSLKDFPDLPEVEEDGNTFAHNAQKKALGYAKATGLMTIADDYGLEVDALDGEPGVHSARYALEENNGVTDRLEVDLNNNRKLLSKLANVPQDKRQARFVCHICLASEKEVLLESHGTIEGQIVDTAAGENGFGYDPIFFVPSLGKTTAQLDSDQKNKISHRANALADFKPMLLKMLNTWLY